MAEKIKIKMTSENIDKLNNIIKKNLYEHSS